MVAGAAARQTEERKHTLNDPIFSKLGWKCASLVVEAFGAWGRTAGQFFFHNLMNVLLHKAIPLRMPFIAAYVSS